MIYTVLQTGNCFYLFFLKFLADKSKNEMPNNKNGIAGVVFLSINFNIDTIKKHIEASKKHILLIFSFLSFSMIFSPPKLIYFSIELSAKQTGSWLMKFSFQYFYLKKQIFLFFR